MTERLSDAQITHIVEHQVDERMGEMLDKPLVDGSAPPPIDNAADLRFLWGFQL